MENHITMNQTHSPILMVYSIHMPWTPLGKFLAQDILNSWNFTVLIKVHNTLGHQGVTRTLHLITWQYNLKGMNKDIP